VAINLPEALRRDLWQAAAPLREPDYPVRWVPAELIHLTVRFLGEVPGSRLGALASALRAATLGVGPFDLAIGTFGVFPNRRRPRVVWVGCEPLPSLELLHHRVESELAARGFAPAGRPFRPHLTLGRARRDAPRSAWEGFIDRLDRLPFAGTVPVTSVDLMESRTGANGPRYTTRNRAPLEA